MPPTREDRAREGMETGRSPELSRSSLRPKDPAKVPVSILQRSRHKGVYMSNQTQNGLVASGKANVCLNTILQRGLGRQALLSGDPYNPELPH